MRLLRGQYKRSLGTISAHFSEVLTAILSLHKEFIKLPDPSSTPLDDYKWILYLLAYLFVFALVLN
jgi:hypothetical protein